MVTLYVVVQYRIFYLYSNPTRYSSPPHDCSFLLVAQQCRIGKYRSVWGTRVEMFSVALAL
jgi:hypothetical protein